MKLFENTAMVRVRLSPHYEDNSRKSRYCRNIWTKLFADTENTSKLKKRGDAINRKAMLKLIEKLNLGGKQNRNGIILAKVRLIMSQKSLNSNGRSSVQYRTPSQASCFCLLGSTLSLPVFLLLFLYVEASKCLLRLLPHIVDDYSMIRIDNLG